MVTKDNELMIGDVQQYVHNNISIQHLYSPVVCRNILVTDGAKRKYDKQFNRVNYIANNINDNETVLDLGCNTGFMINQLNALKTIKAVGVDNVECLIKLCEYIESFQSMRFTFILDEIDSFILTCRRNNKTFDNVIMSSVFGFERIKPMIDNLLSITNYRLFLEPTNHDLLIIDELNRKYIDPLKELYSIKVLGYTDYQNRPMLMVTKNA